MTREKGGINPHLTTVPAAITVWCPIVAPPSITLCDPINTLFSIIISFLLIVLSNPIHLRCESAELIATKDAISQSSPITTLTSFALISEKKPTVVPTPISGFPLIRTNG